jgi:hypothetical protein
MAPIAPDDDIADHHGTFSVLADGIGHVDDRHFRHQISGHQDRVVVAEHLRLLCMASGIARNAISRLEGQLRGVAYRHDPDSEGVKLAPQIGEGSSNLLAGLWSVRAAKLMRPRLRNDNQIGRRGFQVLQQPVAPFPAMKVGGACPLRGLSDDRAGTLGMGLQAPAHLVGFGDQSRRPVCRVGIPHQHDFRACLRTISARLQSRLLEAEMAILAIKLGSVFLEQEKRRVENSDRRHIRAGENSEGAGVVR